MSGIEPLSARPPVATADLWGEQLVKDLSSFEYEARAHPRTKLTVEIVVCATNGMASVFGAPFKAITTDVSPSGMGFLHTSAVPAKFLAITLGQNGQRVFVLVEVARCRSVGNFYEIGVKFIRPLDAVDR